MRLLRGNCLASTPRVDRLLVLRVRRESISSYRGTTLQWQTVFHTPVWIENRPNDHFTNFSPKVKNMAEAFLILNPLIASIHPN